MKNFMRSTGFSERAAFITKIGNMQPTITVEFLQPNVQFSRAVFGTMAFIGKETLVRLKSPLIIFFPIRTIISFPIARTLLT